MPRHYRDQYKPWLPGAMVVEVMPHDLSTLNLLPPGPGQRYHPEPSIALAAFKVNRILAAMVAGETP